MASSTSVRRGDTDREQVSRAEERHAAIEKLEREREEAARRGGAHGGPVDGFVSAARNKLARSPYGKAATPTAAAPSVFGEFTA